MRCCSMPILGRRCMSDLALSLRDVTAGYVADLPILHGVSLAAPKEQITLIIGPNGAGKSTLIKAIAGLLRVSSGTVELFGQAITGIRPDQLALHGVAYIPQTDNIFRSLTIEQNLDLARRRSRGGLDALWDQFPALAAKRRDKAGTLSGGQRQLLAIAMALAGAPKVILMDEPSAGLSPKATEEVLQQARSLTETGVTVLLVEQNVKQAMAIADHCYILAEGRNQVDGPAETLRFDKILAEIYLGGRRIGAA